MACLLWGILHTNSRNVLTDLDSDVIDELTDTIHLEVSDCEVELLWQTEYREG